jgi:hypothetical protein
MIPGTGNQTIDVVLEVGIVVALLVLIVLMVRNFRDR